MNTEELREAYGYTEVYPIDQPKTAFQMVKQFHKTYGQPVGDKPQLLTGLREEFRVRLIDEEYQEVMEALDDNDLVNLAKELADLIYVVNGFAVELGIDLDAVVKEVHRSNMSKLDANGRPIYREDGKVLKGPHYFEADVESVLGL